MFSPYRIAIEKLANAYLDKSKPDSADKWLKWGKRNIPFYPKLRKNSAALRYAATFAKTGDMKNALDMVEKSRKRVLSNLKFYFKKYQNLRSKIAKVRRSAQTENQKDMKAQIRRLASSYQNISDNLSSVNFNLLLMQHIYYEAGKDDKGNQLGATVNKLTNGLLKFPTSKKKNKKTMSKLGY